MESSSSSNHTQGGPKITYIPNQSLSQMLPWSTLILAACLATFIVLAYCSERWILRAIYPRVYTELERETLTSGSDRRRKGFVYCHLSGLMKVSLLLVAINPAYRIFIGSENFDAPMSPGSIVKLGDMALVFMQLYSAYYIWELCYRASHASYINVAHHAGLLFIGQIAVSLSVDWLASPEATIEFYMCLVWGGFDLVSEWPISAALIIRRLQSGKHRMLGRMFIFCAGWCLAFTFAEIVVTAYLLHVSWDRWPVGWRVATPCVFAVWCIAQLWSTKQILEIGMAERKKYLESKAQWAVDVESAKESRKSDSSEEPLQTTVQVLRVPAREKV